MSLIHDALQKGENFRWMLPSVSGSSFRASRAAARPAFRLSSLKFPLILVSLLLFFSWCFFVWVHYRDSRLPQVSPKTRAVHPLPSRPPVRVSQVSSFTSLTAGGKFVLTGMVTGNEDLAVINDQVVGVGDRVGRALVKEIQGRRVVLEFQGREVYLTLST